VKIAVVAGGWHWPMHFFRTMAKQTQFADLYVVAHRCPDRAIVATEKVEALRTAPGPLGALDRELYAEYATVEKLQRLGWTYEEAPNVCGDWCFLNQWLERHDYRRYNVILSCHDDTYIRRHDLFEQLAGNWLVLANGSNSVEPVDYMRGSFEFFTRELLDLVNGHIDLGPVMLTREGREDSPGSRQELQPWNDTCLPLRHFLVERGLCDRIARLSPHYRVSPWAIEGERGFLHMQAWAPEWRMDRGLEAYPV
jgi:hypothetical protein